MPQPDLPAPPRHARSTDLAVERYGELGRAWVAGLWQGDESADAVAADLAGIGREHGRAHRRRLVDRAIAGDPDPAQPASLTALLDGLAVEPHWVDHDQLDRAGDHLARNSAQLGITLAAASLMVGYTNPAAAKPLVLTGRLVDDAGVRNLEVGDWLREVTTHGGMRRDGLGFERTVRVRLIHADVRRFVGRHPDWDPDVLGTPVSQPYMAHTLAEFGCIALDAMAVLGARYSAAERADIYALWRYVGLVSGVRPELLPRDEAEQQAIRELYQLTRPPIDDDSRALVRGLVDDYLVPEVADLLPARTPRRTALARGYVRGIVHALVGEDLAGELGVPRSRFTRAVRPLGHLQAVGYAAWQGLPGGTAHRVRRGRRYRAEQEQRLREKYAMTHDLVDSAPPGEPAR